MGRPILLCAHIFGRCRFRTRRRMVGAFSSHPSPNIKNRWIIIELQREEYSSNRLLTHSLGYCPLVRNTKFKDNGARLALFRIWLVMQELVQFYLYFLTGSETEVLDINEAMALGGKASTRNTQNYIYYAASKCFPLLLPHRFRPTRPFSGDSIIWTIKNALYLRGVIS